MFRMVKGLVLLGFHGFQGVWYLLFPHRVDVTGSFRFRVLCSSGIHGPGPKTC